MKTKKKWAHVLCGVLLLCAGRVYGQATVLGNSGGPGDHLGWDNLSTMPLEVRHDGPYPIDWYTNALHRMRLYPANSTTLNTFNVPRHGFVGISQQPLFFSSGPGPFSRLHLVDSVDNNISTYAQDPGYRPWMRNGVTMTGNGDQMYVGHKYTYVDSTDYTSGEVIDRSDAVIEWSDKQRLRQPRPTPTCAAGVGRGNFDLMRC